MRRHLGEVRHDELVERMQDNFHYTPADRKEMLVHYRGEYDRIRQLRMEGNVGPIEIVSFD